MARSRHTIALQKGKPPWPKPTAVVANPGAPSIRSGKLTLRHAGELAEGFSLAVDGELMAIGWDRGLIGYMNRDRPAWSGEDQRRK